MPPLVSVIIPVYRDWVLLRSCLDALTAQTLSRDQFEVIVVNNGETVEAPGGGGIDHFLHEPAGFSYQARNAGLGQARGAYLAFTDADCRPEQDWLQAGVAALQVGDADVLGGDIRIQTGSRNLAAWYDAVFGLKQEHYLHALGGMATANLFVKREVFERIGSFEGHLPSGGDISFCRRAGEAGFSVRYSPAPVVLHPARDSWSAILGQRRRHTIGRVQRIWHDQPTSRPTRWQFLWRFYRPRPRDWWQLLAAHDARVAEYGLLHRCVLLVLHVVMHYHRAVIATKAVRSPIDASQKHDLL